jgi:hypothetical protein
LRSLLIVSFLPSFLLLRNTGLTLTLHKEVAPMHKIYPCLLALVLYSFASIALAAKPAQLHDRIPANGTTANGYVTWYTDDNPGPPPDADYFPAGAAQDVHDAHETAHARFVLYGFNDPEYSAFPKETYIYDSPNGGSAPHDCITIDAPGKRNASEPRNRSTVLHELFHHVQYNYIVYNQWVSWGRWTIEGTARMMEDKTFLDLDTDTPNTLYFGEVNGYLNNPSRPLMDLSYAACLFWNYLTEQYGANPADFHVGTEVIRTFWERCDGHAPDSLKYLNETIAHYEPGKQLKDVFIDFLIANYVKDLDVSALPNKDRYSYIDDDDLDAAGNPITYAAVARTSYALPPNVVDQPDNVPRWAGKWYDATVSANSQIVGFRAQSTNGQPLSAAAISIKGGNRVSQVFKSRGQEFAVAFLNRTADLITSIAGVVGGLDDAVDFEYTIAEGVAKLSIQSPTWQYPAYVGPKDQPERFVAKIRVEGPNVLGSPSVQGLHHTDFTARVGLEDAPILDGTYVQGDYWLLIQAPEQTAAGEEFDLHVYLGDISAGQDDAVIYRKIVRDQIMLIDGSGSMLDGGKIDAAKNAASLLVDSKADGDMLGVVRFHGNSSEPDVDATVEFALSNVDDLARETAKQKIEDINIPDAGVTTSIGDGVDVSQDQLDASGRPDDRHIIVLLSDGMENEALFWADVKPDVLAKGTVIHTIALGPGDHHDLMESIADDTGGEYYYVTTTVEAAIAPDDDPLPNRLADVYKQIEEEIAGHQRLWYTKSQVAAGGDEDHLFNLTEDGVRDAVIAVNWNKRGDQLGVVLGDPDGNKIGPGTAGIQYFESPTHVVYRLPNMKKGRWTIAVESKAGGPTNYVASISGWILHGVDLDVYIRELRSGRWLGLPVQIIANLTDYKGPIRDAEVVATVFHPKGIVYTVKLRDDGNHGDGTAGDGIYANTFTRTTEQGSYIVEVTARGKSNFGEAFERIKSRAFSVRYNEKEFDTDGDKMPDLWERLHGLKVGENDSREDKDADGVLNIDEFYAGTNPNDPDTDGGGESDFSELKRGSDPCDEDDDSIPRPEDVGVVHEMSCPDGEFGFFEPRTNLIHFPVHPAYKALLLYRHTGAASPDMFTLVKEIDPATYPGLYPDKGLVNGTEYLYFLVATGLNDAQSARSPIFSGTAKDDPVPPRGWVAINDGAWRITSLDVTLTFDPSPDSTEVIVSNNASFKGALWRPKPDAMPWTLEPLPGTSYATVYAKFRDPAGNESILEHDTILVDLDDDADDDGLPDFLDLDDDNDLLLDTLELHIGLDPFRFDSDGDGIPDPEEDRDRDGQDNHTEAVGGSDPGDPDSVFRGHVAEIGLDTIRIEWPYVPGRRYRLLSTNRPEEGKWTEVPGGYHVDGDTAWQEDSITGMDRRFYVVQAEAIPISFNAITKDDIAEAPLSSARIDGSDGNNQLTPGSIILCRTSMGRFCKFLIEDFGVTAPHVLTIRWVTYNANGTIHSQGSGLTVRGTWHCDLDEGLETSVDSDFWWVQETSTTRYLLPENGALFFKAW